MTLATPDRPSAAGVVRTAAWTRRLAVALAALAGALLLFELGLRVAGFRLPGRASVGDFESRASARFVVDEHTGWRMREAQVVEHANPTGERIAYRSDARGFRCGDVSDARESGPLLAVAGDSFAWGCDVQHEQAFGALVARELGAWRLANVAMPGFGLDQIWLSVREHALPLRPQLVLVAIFLDDLERSRTAFREVEGFAKPMFALRGGELVPQSRADAPGRIARGLGQLRVAQFVDASLRHLGRHARVGEWWQLNAAILERMHGDCASAGVPLLFVFVPDDHWTTFPSLRRHLRELGAAYLDPTESEPTQPAGLYFENTGRPEHLDADGHAYLGALITRWLRANPHMYLASVGPSSSDESGAAAR